MRHSTIALTMDTYTHSARGALGSALAKLPDLSGPDRQTVRATGTDDAACELSTPGEKTGGRTGGNRVQNDADSVRDGAVKTARSGVTATTVNARNARELQRTETHAKEKAATGFEPVNDGFANRSLRPLGYAAQKPATRSDPRRRRSDSSLEQALSRLPPIEATPSAGILLTDLIGRLRACLLASVG